MEELSLDDGSKGQRYERLTKTLRGGKRQERIREKPDYGPPVSPQTKGMMEQACDFRDNPDEFIAPPDYPFTARQLFGDLRSRLDDEHKTHMSFERLARLIGQATSTTHHWFRIYDHPHVIGFMALLERLSPASRQTFIETHCRVLPTLADPRLTHSPEQVVRFEFLLNQARGLTVLAGGTDWSRIFLVTAFGHYCRHCNGRQKPPAGIDIHRPSRFVPVASLTYIDDSLALHRIRELTIKAWPRIMTSNARLLLFNRVWSLVPEVREDLVRCARRKNVVIAEEGVPKLAGLRSKISTPTHLLTVSGVKGVPEGIHVDCRQFTACKTFP